MSPWLQCEDEWTGDQLARFAVGGVGLMEAGPGADGGEEVDLSESDLLCKVWRWAIHQGRECCKEASFGTGWDMRGSDLI